MMGAMGHTTAREEARSAGSLPAGLQAAARIGEALSQGGVPYAVIGGLAVQANTWEAGADVAHARSNVDLLLNRADIEKAKSVLGGLGYHLELLSELLRNRTPDALRYVRAVLAGELFSPGSFDEAPLLSQATTYRSALGFQCLRVAPLLGMKLSAYRNVDKVHVQDMLEAGVVSREAERSLRGDHYLRLQHMKEVTEEERRG